LQHLEGLLELPQAYVDAPDVHQARSQALPVFLRLAEFKALAVIGEGLAQVSQLKGYRAQVVQCARLPDGIVGSPVHRQAFLVMGAGFPVAPEEL
jgi:hypothetical protein